MLRKRNFVAADVYVSHLFKIFQKLKGTRELSSIPHHAFVSKHFMHMKQNFHNKMLNIDGIHVSIITDILKLAQQNDSFLMSAQTNKVTSIKINTVLIL